MSSSEDSAGAADLEESKPVAETPCNSHGDFRHVPADDLPNTFKTPCPQCFPDGSIPSHIDWVLFPRQGDNYHKSRDDGDAYYPAAHDGGNQDLTRLLADENVQSIADLQEVDL